MGIFRRLLGLERNLLRLVSTDIVVDEDHNYHVTFASHHPDLRDSELVRLVLHYYAKMLFNFDPSDPNMSFSATMLNGMMATLVQHGIEKGTDVFKAAHVTDSARMVAAPPGNVPRTIKATMYFVDPIQRHITTKIPRKTYVQQMVFSVAALLQATIDKLPPEEIAVMGRSLGYMTAAYASGEDRAEPQNLLRIPSVAYMSAVVGKE